MEQILVLQNVMNLSMSETLDTYVYKVGLIQMSFSYATAVGLFKSIVAVILLYGANTVSKRVAQRGLF
jgi:putative aldouronate transport system permease protein